MRGLIPWQRGVDDRLEVVDELAVDLCHTGLLAVDIQYFCASPEHGRGKWLRDLEPDRWNTWVKVMKNQVIPNVQRLLAWFRSHQLPVIHFRVGSKLPSGADSFRLRREGRLKEPHTGYAADHPLTAILAEVGPEPGELVLDKNTGSAFPGSPVGFYLHNLGLQTLVVCGVSTHACVMNTARDAADLGYNVILVSDACYSSTGDEAHHWALYRFQRVFGAVKSTAAVLHEFDQIVAGGRPGGVPSSLDSEGG